MSVYITNKPEITKPYDHAAFTAVLRRLGDGLNVDVVQTTKVIQGLLPDGEITRVEFDELAARTCASRTLRHHDYGLLGGRILAESLQKTVGLPFSQNCARLFDHAPNGKHEPLLAQDVYDLVVRNEEKLDAAIAPERDLDLRFFGLRTLQRTYLIRSGIDRTIWETPQYMFMRVALGTCAGDVDVAIQTYHDMSTRKYVHATPTLFNAGTPRPQLSSCFLLQMPSDSLEGIMVGLTQCAQISKHAGGIGLSFHNIRAKGSRIRGTNGTSNGLVPLHRVANQLSLYVDQGGGKRKGSIACYLEPWHADVEDWIQLRLPVGSEEARARDLFYALWVPDLFMKRVQTNEQWTLMCPNVCPGLDECWGDEFETLYEKYEAEGRGVRTIKAQDLWFRILTSQVETGGPYLLYKDACNRKSNQQNLGCIKSSNLCAEIVQYTSPDEIAVCNLASVVLPSYVTATGFDFEELEAHVRRVTRNLDRVIDINYYPLPEAKNSNFRHRPIGIGVQGLADVFQRLRLPYDSKEAVQLDAHIFETIYFAAVSESCAGAKERGPYETFSGSPASEGRLQFDMWDKTEEVYTNGIVGRERWEALKADVVEHGLRNSLLTSPMPTASTSQIMGSFTQAFHPIPTVLYQRRTQSGDFLLCCPAFVDEMVFRNLWTDEVRNVLQRCEGRLSNPMCEGVVPDDLRALFKSVWDTKQKFVVDHALARGPFIDQSQSMELWLESPTTKTLTSMHFYGWKKGLKTGLYYLRSRSKAHSINFSVTHQSQDACSREAKEEECLSCGS